MLSYDDIDYIELVDLMDIKRDYSFCVNLYEEKEVCGKIEIRRNGIYDSYPIQFDVYINGFGLLNFKIENYQYCLCYIENIHSQTEGKGIGTILFDIMYHMIHIQTNKLGLELKEISGKLSEHHHDFGDWLNSIPFYIKQAYKYNLPIQFKFENNIIIISQETHPQYSIKENAKIFATELMSKTKKLTFSILINKTNDLDYDQ